MQWNDWPIVFFTLLTLLCLLGRRWTDAVVFACFAVLVSFDKLPGAIPRQLEYLFLLVAVAIVVTQVLKAYGKHKKSLASR